MKSKIFYIIGFLLVLILSGIGGYLIGNSEEVQTFEKLIYKTKIDTVIIKKYQTLLKSKIDTIIVRDTIISKEPEENVIAYADTFLTYTESVDDIDTLKLKITYYFPPINQFDIKTRLIQFSKLKIEPIYIEKPRGILNRFSIGIGSGLSYGIINKADISFHIGIYYSLWDF